MSLMGMGLVTCNGDISGYLMGCQLQSPVNYSHCPSWPILAQLNCWAIHSTGMLMQTYKPALTPKESGKIGTTTLKVGG